MDAAAPVLLITLPGERAGMFEDVPEGVRIAGWSPGDPLPEEVGFAAAFVLCGPDWARTLIAHPAWVERISLALRLIVRVVPVLVDGAAAPDLGTAPGRTGLLEGQQAIYWDGTPGTRAQLADLLAGIADAWRRQHALREIDRQVADDPAVRAIISANIAASFGDFGE